MTGGLPGGCAAAGGSSGTGGNGVGWDGTGWDGVEGVGSVFSRFVKLGSGTGRVGMGWVTGFRKLAGG